MRDRLPRIGVLFFSEEDRALLRQLLQKEGFDVFAPDPAHFSPADFATVDLILVDAAAAKKFGPELIGLKNRAGLTFAFLPVLVAQPFSEPAGPWLSAGFDDVVPIPIVPPLLSVRVRTWLRIRADTTGRFRAMVEESPLGFYRTTPDGRILYANPALVRMLGFSSFSELSQHNMEELAQRSGYSRAHFKELLEKHGEIRGFESVWIRADGTKLWMRESAHVVRDEFGRILYYEGTVENITAEHELNTKLNAVQELGRKLVLYRSLEEIARAVAEAVCAIVGFTDVSFYFLDESRNELVLLFHSLGASPGPARLPLHSEKGVVVRAARTGEIQNIPDVSKEPAYIRTYPNNCSELAIPLKVGEKVVGVLNVESEKPGAFGPKDEHILSVLAAMAAVAIENARLFGQLEELRRFHEEIVHALAEGVIVVDPQGRITFANPASGRLLGFAPAELLGKDFLDLVAPPFRDFVKQEWLRRERGEEGEYEALLLRRDGTTIPVLIHARPLFAGEKFQGSLKAFTDVSLLKEFETRYRYFAEQTEEGFYRLELKEPVSFDLPLEERVQRICTSAVLAEANDAFARHYGFSRAAELQGRTLCELFSGEVPADFRQMLKEFLENGGKITAREALVRLRNGKERWFSYTAVGLFKNGKFWAIWGTQRDITRQKEAEERLKRELQRFAVLHRASQEIVQSLVEPEKVYEAVHRAVAELMPAEAFVIAIKTSEEEAEAVYLFDKGGRFPPQKVPKGQGITWHVLSTEKPLLVRDFLEEKIPAIHFGTEEPVRSILAVPLKAGGETIGMLSTQSYEVGAFTEEDLALLELLGAYVAAALRAAQLLSALRESENRFRRLAENAQDIIYRYRLKPKPGFEYVNPAATRIVGYTPEEHYADPELGMKIIHPEDRPVLEALRQGEGFFYKPLEFQWVHKDGRIVWTEQINIPVYDEKGELVAIEGIARDVTERKRAEEEAASLGAGRGGGALSTCGCPLLGHGAPRSLYGRAPAPRGGSGLRHR